MFTAGLGIVLVCVAGAAEENGTRPVSFSVWAIQASGGGWAASSASGQVGRTPAGGTNRTPPGSPGHTLRGGTRQSPPARIRRTPHGGSGRTPQGRAAPVPPVRATAPAPKQFDQGAQPISEALADLPYKRYDTIRADRRAAPYRQQTRVAINPRYTLCVSPISREPDGRIRTELCVEMAPRQKGERPVKALETRVLMAPGKAVKLRGLRLEEGELVIVLVVGG